MNDFEMGYIMGLVVGEGSFTGDRKKGWLAIKLHMNDPEPLLAAQRLLGGRIYGPYHHDGRHFLLYKLYGLELVNALPIFTEHLPKSHKRDQFNLKFPDSLLRGRRFAVEGVQREQRSLWSRAR